MEENNQFFLPKGTDGRKKDIMILHIMSFGLIAALLLMLFSAFGVLLRSVIEILLIQFDVFGAPATDLQDIMNQGLMDAASAQALMPASYVMFSNIMKLLNTVGYIVTFASMVVVIALVVFMRKRVRDIIEDPFPMDNPVRFKKTPFIWLGFLLGGFGGHLFYIKKTKRAWIYLILGVLGTVLGVLPVLFIYTSAISFADAFLACFIPKDEDGYIEMEDYPYWV